MPRRARIDAVGLLQHVMARGIEKRDIFLNEGDRKDFVLRLSDVLTKSGTACLAWSLMSNHFHLLLRPQKTALACLMRSLLTGYAVTFNLRHKRSGHLFQNRYHSIVCEEESYLRELIRYIHLNPIRAGVVSSLQDLEKYPWTGHSVLLGRTELPGQAVEGVLSMFGNDLAGARLRYAGFVSEGVDEGHREEFCGGGLARSVALLGGNPEDEAYDGRVLGCGDFVLDVIGDKELEIDEPMVEWDSLMREIAAAYHLEVSQVYQNTKVRKIAEARAVTCYVARGCGYRCVDIAHRLNMSPSGVTVAAKRGKTLASRGLPAAISIGAYFKA